MIKNTSDYFCATRNTFKHFLLENSKSQTAKHERVRQKGLYIMETQYGHDKTRCFPVKEVAEKVVRGY